ncbi:MAG: PHP domain-containing protein [Spirochaetales bacterium]|nr:PHP domain-containing protein [Spirochaetales bacterium]
MIDLHTHTTCSDGSLTPSELVNRAVKIGLNALAITDHDNTDGIDEAIKAAEGKDLRIVPGIEIEIDFKPGEFHLLGLGLKDWKGSLEQAMVNVKNKRHERNLRIIDMMKEEGWDITLEDVSLHAGSNLIARPHFAAAMVEKKIVRNTRLAFDKYLAAGRPFYTRKEALSLEEAVKLILDAGGVPVIAHPLSLFLSWGKLPGKLEEFKEQGVQGLEAWHPSVNKRKAERLINLAEELDFLVTGGSDFHGDLRKDRKLGHSSDGRTIPDEYLAPFI